MKNNWQLNLGRGTGFSRWGFDWNGRGGVRLKTVLERRRGGLA